MDGGTGTGHLLLLHLSDLHLPRRPPLELSDCPGRIVDCVRALNLEVDDCVIILSGDIAASGLAEEYDAALRLLRDLNRELLQLTTAREITLVAVPGNHDCCLEGETKQRTQLIHELRETGRSPTTEETQLLLEVQANFARFAAQLAGKDASPTPQLLYSRKVPAGGRGVRVDCLNTAWMSLKEERSGGLSFPVDRLPPEPPDATLVVAVLHHPYAWFKPDVARRLRTYLNDRSDVVLTGHEHDPSQCSQAWGSGQTVLYVEGALFHHTGPFESGFNIVEVISGSRMLVHQANWSASKHIYVSSRPIGPCGFNRIRQGLRDTFRMSDAFADELRDPGAILHHPNKETLALDDYFVYPDLRQFRPLSTGLRDEPFEIQSDQVAEFFLRCGCAMVYGAVQCGKTSLLRSLMPFLLSQGCIPVMISGSQIRTGQKKDLEKLVWSSFENQYSPELLEQYKQEPSMHKCLLVDDWDEARLAKKVRAGVLKYMVGSFGRVILTCDEALLTEEYAASELDQQSPILAQCEILRLNHRLRARLIKKWALLGREQTSDADNIAFPIREAERLVNDVLGNNYAPAFPIVILTILQARDNPLPMNLGPSSLCYYYHALINLALVSCVRSPSDPGVDELHGFLGELAHAVLEKRQERAFLTVDEVGQVGQEYKRRYALGIDISSICQSLCAARILRREDGQISFTYRFLFYYFAGYYLSRNLRAADESEKTLALTRQLIDGVALEGNANVLLFLSYHTMDPIVMDEIIVGARRVLPGEAPLELIADVSTFAGWLGQPLPFSVGSLAPSAERDRVRNGRDLAEIASPPPGDRTIFEDHREPDNDESIGLKAAYQYTRILGQLLRHFPGTLRAEDKERLCEEAFQLVLRIAGAALRGLEHLGTLVLQTPDRLPDSESRRAQVSSHDLGLLSLGFGYALLGEAGASVGGPKLKETYKQLLDKRPMLAYRLIIAAIELEHVLNVDFQKIISLYNDIAHCRWTVSLLRWLVAMRLRSFPPERGVRQNVCNRLGIRDSAVFIQLERRE